MSNYQEKAGKLGGARKLGSWKALKLIADSS
jgi:hypothetical protein